jgi:lysophospholipid acyltransferase (LPLAT)-like uncharacterized protein
MNNKLLSLLISFIFRLLHWSYRFQWPDGHFKLSRYIYAIWHQNLFAGINCHINIPHVVMASQSKDGEIISQVMLRLAFVVARGSSSRGGGQALTKMVETLAGNTLPAALTVDGPRGPAYECKLGVIILAAQTGIPILPYIALPKHYWEFRSWDKFRMPKPFSPIYCFTGPEIYVPKSPSEEELAKFQLDVKNSLDTLEQKAQAYRAGKVL